MSVPMSSRAQMSRADEPRSHGSLTEANVGKRRRRVHDNEQRRPYEQCL